MKRHNLSLRRKTTVIQKLGSYYAQQLADFFTTIRIIREYWNYDESSIIAADETSVWLDAVGGTTVDVVGKKEIAIATTGHDKSRVTVMLAACADGTKKKPAILIPYKKERPECEPYKSKVQLIYEGTVWFNDKITERWLRENIKGSIFGRKLLVWDSFGCHVQCLANCGARTFCGAYRSPTHQAVHQGASCYL